MGQCVSIHLMVLPLLIQQERAIAYHEENSLIINTNNEITDFIHNYMNWEDDELWDEQDNIDANDAYGSRIKMKCLTKPGQELCACKSQHSHRIYECHQAQSHENRGQCTISFLSLYRAFLVIICIHEITLLLSTL